MSDTKQPEIDPEEHPAVVFQGLCAEIERLQGEIIHLQGTNRILLDTNNLANATSREAITELVQAREDLGTLIQAVKDFGLSNCADDLIAVVKRFKVVG